MVFELWFWARWMMSVSVRGGGGGGEWAVVVGGGGGIGGWVFLSRTGRVWGEERGLV